MLPRNRASRMRRGEREEEKTSERSRRDRGDAGEEVRRVHAAAPRNRVDCTRYCCRFEASRFIANISEQTAGVTVEHCTRDDNLVVK